MAKAGADGLNLDTMDSLGPFVVPPSQSKPDLWWQNDAKCLMQRQRPAESIGIRSVLQFQVISSDAAMPLCPSMSSGDAGDCILQCGTEGGLGICCLFLPDSISCWEHEGSATQQEIQKFRCMAGMGRPHG